MTDSVLVRYGSIPEVARFRVGDVETVQRGQRVVVRSHRGIELGTVLEPAVAPPGGANGNHTADQTEPTILRSALPEDEQAARRLRSECEQQFDQWRQRIRDWQLDLQLIDMESTLDASKLVLYVLNERGPDCTQLAIKAAAAGLGIVEVQPVNGEGLVHQEQTGGACGCHG